MFVANDRHLQMPMFSSLDSLPEKIRKRLESSWAVTFYNQVFVRIGESRFAVLYSDEPSRPTFPSTSWWALRFSSPALAGATRRCTIISALIQVRRALGYRDLGVGHFELRTVYNFRQRLSEYMQETGENLFEQVFEQITDEQLATFQRLTNYAWTAP